MLQFDEYKVKLNNLAPALEELAQALDLESAERELDMLQAESAADGFWDNLAKAQKVQQRIKNLQDKVDGQKKRQSQWDDMMAMCEMGNEFEDESLLPELEESFQTLEHEMEEARLATLLTGEYDSSNVILTIHPGAGGTEAQDWAQMLYRMYTRWTERHGFTYQIMDYQEGDEAGIKSATIMIEGENAYGYLRGEHGVHRLVRVSPFDANARRQTSFASVEVMPDLPEDVEVEIRAGVGGEEAALFAHSLYRMYAMYAERRGWRAEVDSVSETELGGVKEISFTIEGEGAFSRLKYESGVHRVQRVPETESGGRVHTSTVTVAVLPEMETADVRLDMADIEMQVFRSSGAGGQHVNKTSSAVRLIHRPTGTVVECQQERSQFQNRDKAMRILASRLYEAEQEKISSEYTAQRRSQIGSGMRNERIRTYNFPQGRVTDHRIGLTLYKIDSIMNGDLNELMDALAAADQAQRLNEQN